MDFIKEKIEEIVEKIKADEKFAEKFRKDPITAVEGVLGVDLPNDTIEKIVDGIKAKVELDKVGDLIGGLSGLFGKK